MALLSMKTAQEISELLDYYGIKHGPVVDSTRSLYEKKLKEAMAKDKRTKYEPLPDKTYYREEEDEVITYVRRTPVRSEGAGDYGDGASYMRSRSNWNDREFQQEASHSTYTRPRYENRGGDLVEEPYYYDKTPSYRNPSTSTPMKSGQDAPKAPQSKSRLIPLWVQFMFFLAVAIFLYIVFSSMESNESLKGIE